MRPAGALINQYLREGKLSSNRSNPIGQGGNGVVYESDLPGNVIKQLSYQDQGKFGLPGDQPKVIDEANLQAVAAEMGIAPRVAAVETFRGGIGNRIEMEDIRDNFENAFVADVGNLKALRATDVKVSQQLGQLALKGIYLQDRNPGNVYKNKMTGRPMQIDFGIADRVSGADQVQALAEATADGFTAAGIGDVADIFRATVYDLLEGGDVDDAMDIAKQGFSRLQKIKHIA